MKFAYRIFVSAALLAAGVVFIARTSFIADFDLDPVLVWVAVLVLPVFVFWILPARPTAIERKTDPGRLAAIEAAKDSWDLMKILDDNYSHEFSSEENEAFKKRTEELKLTGYQWAKVAKAVDGERSFIARLAREKMSK